MPPAEPENGTAPPAALAAFCPERFGFRPYHAGWLATDPGGAVAIAPLSWQHAHAAAPEDGSSARNALGFLVGLQARTWGMPPEEVVPANVLAVLADTGGSVLVAYDPSAGFDERGWLGFAIAFGGRGGTLVSHMLGVREDARGARDIGWRLKLVQGYVALRSGHAAATWTFDPMRGANARLNLEKLGARAEAFTVDKYGALQSDLYGEVPSDRLTVRWDLLAPTTARRLREVATGRYRGPTPSEVAALPEATPATLGVLLDGAPRRLRYRIPDDVDALMERDPEASVRWRREMRHVLGALLPTAEACPDPDAPADPARIGVRSRSGAYAVVGFATGTDPDASGRRANFYLLERVAR